MIYFAFATILEKKLAVVCNTMIDLKINCFYHIPNCIDKTCETMKNVFEELIHIKQHEA